MHISPQEVDKINILEARKLGMAQAIKGLKKVKYTIFNGNFIPPNVEYESDYLIKGDEKIACISAASILAKGTRDRLMIEQAKLYPEYGFEQHKGYLTKVHLEALSKFGPCEIHRMTYKPIKDSIK